MTRECSPTPNPQTSPVEQKGQWWPVTAEQIGELQAKGRLAIEADVIAEVLDAYPTAKNIKVIFHVWDDRDLSGNAAAREHYGYPEDTMGTLGWKAEIPEEAS